MRLDKLAVSIFSLNEKRKAEKFLKKHLFYKKIIKSYRRTIRGMIVVKRLFKVLIMFVFVFSFFSFNSVKTEAATTKIAHVNIKTLNVRSGAGTKYKKVGSLKKDAGVYVYSKTKSGWSEIRYKKKKAYVATKYLKFADSYLMDKTKVYRYMNMLSNGGIEEYVYKETNSKGQDVWKVYEGNNKFISNQIVYEDKNGLYEGFLNSSNDEFFTLKYNNIKYPVKVGKTFYELDDNDEDLFNALILCLKQLKHQQVHLKIVLK